MQQIKAKIGQVPHFVFDVVSENPQKQHVACQMHPAAVQEHRREHGIWHFAPTEPFGDHGPVPIDFVYRLRIRKRRSIAEKYQDVHGYKRVCDIGRAPRRVVIANW